MEKHKVVLKKLKLLVPVLDEKNEYYELWQDIRRVISELEDRIINTTSYVEEV